jgi:hypothetical protein
MELYSQVWVAPACGDCSSTKSFSEERGNTLDRFRENPIWKALWSFKVPPKVRVFWWCLIHDYIPTRANLHHQDIDPLSTCDTCGACDETTFHALMECTYARRFGEIKIS